MVALPTGSQGYNPPCGRIAQLVRASLLHREGQGFESLCAHRNPGFKTGVFIYRKSLVLPGTLVPGLCESTIALSLLSDSCARGRNPIGPS